MDGIRGLAILLVLIWHLFEIPLGFEPSGAKLIRRVFALTWTGVDIFFVLSGFLIIGILLDQRGRARYFSRFYIRRSFRILPLYYLLLGACALAPALAQHLDRIAPWSVYALILQNFVMAQKGSMGGLPLGVTWSLGVEEQFYLIIPVLVALLPRRALGAVLALTVLAGPLLRLHYGGLAAYVLMPCRADALALGGLLALLLRTPVDSDRLRKLAWGALLADLVTSALLIWKNQGIGASATNAVGYSAFALGGAALVVFAVTDPGGIIARTLGNHSLRLLGKLAYGLYLLHMPVLVLCRTYLHTPAEVHSWAQIVPVAMIPLGITLGLAWLSWHFFEGPLVSLGHRITTAREPAAMPAPAPAAAE